MKKPILSVLLVLTLVLAIFILPAAAAEPAARIAETEVTYETVQAAIDAAASGQTVQLLRDVTESVTVANDDNLTLDLNGKNLTASSDIAVKNNGTLTLTDSTDAPGSVVISGSSLLYDIVNYGTLTVNKIKISGHSTANVVIGVDNYGSITVNEASFEITSDSSTAQGLNNKEKYNGQKIIAELNNATITVQAAYNAYGLVNANTATVNGGTFDVSCTGNAAYCLNNMSAITVTGGTFTARNARHVYGMWNNVGADATVTGGKFETVASQASVDVFGIWQAGTMTVGGSLNVTGSIHNLYLRTGKTVTVGTGENAPTTMEIGVTLQSGTGAFTGANSTDYNLYFTSDNIAYVVSCGESNVLSLMEPAPTAEDFTFAAPDNLTFTGLSKEAQFTSGKQGIGELTVKYYDSDGILLENPPENVGTYTVKLDVAEGTTCAGVKDLTDPSWTFTIEPMNLNNCTVQPITSPYFQTGEEIKPDVIVGNGMKILNPEENYTVDYSDNTEPGTATATITGKGNYTGTVQVTFQIVALGSSSTSGLYDYTVRRADKDATVILGEGTVLTPEDLKSVKMDGEDMEAGSCTVESGCIKITLTKDYLNTLKAGKHTLTVELGGNYDGVKYEDSFTVRNTYLLDDSDSDTEIGSFLDNEKSSESSNNGDRSPNTGDVSHTALWVTLAGVSLAGAAAAVVIGKRKKSGEEK